MFYIFYSAFLISSVYFTDSLATPMFVLVGTLIGAVCLSGGITVTRGETECKKT